MSEIQKSSDEKTSLVLIGQQQRCGGSLLIRLFDNHEQLFVHPTENYFGRPYKYHLPEINVNLSPEDVWKNLQDPPLASGKSVKYIGKGGFFTKYDSKAHLNFFISNYPSNPTYESICLHYLHSLFQAYPDYCYPASPKYYLYFTPRQALYGEEVLKCFRGSHVIQVIRNPLGFLNSAIKHNRYYDRDTAKFIWRLLFFNAVKLIKKNLKNFHIVIFENLVSDPGSQMKALCDKLGVHFSDKLLSPTFSGIPWRGDSSYKKKLNGIDRNVSDHYKKYLDKEEINYFSEEMEYYELLKELCNGGADLRVLEFPQIENYLVLFDQYMDLYKEKKPVNTKSFVEAPNSKELYEKIMGNKFEKKPLYFYQVSNFAENNLLVKTKEIEEKYQISFPIIHSISGIMNNSFDIDTWSRYLVSIIEVSDTETALKFVEQITPPQMALKLIAKAAEVIKGIDSRGLDFFTLLKFAKIAFLHGGYDSWILSLKILVDWFSKKLVFKFYTLINPKIRL